MYVDCTVGVGADCHGELQQRTVVTENAYVKVVHDQVLYAVNRHVEDWVGYVHSNRLGIYGHFRVLPINNKLVALLRRYHNIPIDRLSREFIEFSLVNDNQTQIPFLGVPDHHNGVVFVAVPYLQGDDAEVVVCDLDDDFLGPYLLVHELLAVVNVYDKVDGALEDQWFVLCHVQRKEKRVLRSRVQTKR